MTFCRQCGFKNDTESRFCQSCGASMAAGSLNDSNSIESAEKMPAAESINTPNAHQECKSCRSAMPHDATKCTKCGEWREDIKKERNLCYLWTFIWNFLLLTFFYGRSEGWWRPEVSPSSGPLGSLVDTIRSSWTTFGWAAFMSSFSGLALIAIFAITFGLSCKYYISVSKKMNNWIWL
jgi:predicted nucleic acid-binding Zn ribbon protein